MLIELGPISLNPDDIRLIVPGAEKTTVFLSTTEGGRTASLDPANAEKLDLFLRAHGRVSLNGPAFKREALEELARLREEEAAYNLLGLLFQTKANLEAIKNRLAAASVQSARLPPEPSPTGIHAVERAPTIQTPPALPNLDADDPDPMTFVRRGPKMRNPIIDDL